MEPKKQKQATEMRFFRPGDVCPGCGKQLFVEPLAKYVEGSHFIHFACSCGRYRIFGLLMEVRPAGDREQNTG